MKGTEVVKDASVLKNNATELADQLENLFNNLKGTVLKKMYVLKFYVLFTIFKKE